MPKSAADKNQLNIVFITAAVLIGFLVTPFSISGVNVVIPAMQEEFQLSLLAANWIPAMFMLSNTAMILPAGRLADNYGRKRIYTIGSLIVIVGSIICVLAPNFYYLLAGRFIQGAGSSFIFSSGLALLVSAVPKEKRSIYIGLASACVYIGLSTGPLFGGWLGETYGWRSTFFTLIPLLIMVLCVLMMTRGKDWRSQHHIKLDIGGSLLLALTMTSLITTSTFISYPYSPLGFVISIIAAVLFIKVQKRKSAPLISFKLLQQNRTLIRGISRACLMYSGNYPIVLLIALYVQYVFGLSAIEAGIALFWQAAAMTLAAIVSGKVSQKLTIRAVTTYGIMIFTLGLLILFYAVSTKNLLWIQIALFVMGLGFGSFSPPNNTMSLRHVADDNMGIASSLLSFARVSGNIFGSIGVILFTVVTVGSGIAVSIHNINDFVELTQYITLTSVALAVMAYLITRKPKNSTTTDLPTQQSAKHID